LQSLVTIGPRTGTNPHVSDRAMDSRVFRDLHLGLRRAGDLVDERILVVQGVRYDIRHERLAARGREWEFRSRYEGGIACAS